MIKQEQTTTVKFSQEGSNIHATFTPGVNVGSLTIETVEGVATIPINLADFALLADFTNAVNEELVTWPAIVMPEEMQAEPEE